MADRTTASPRESASPRATPSPQESAFPQGPGSGSTTAGAASDPSAEPVAEYNRRAEAREASAAQWEARHVQLGYVRLALVAIFLAVAWMDFVEHEWPRWLIALPVVAFAAVAVVHSHALRNRAAALRAAEVYRRGLARIADKWAGTNPREARAGVEAGLGTNGRAAANLYADGLNTNGLYANDLYAKDLDIVGHDGLFELLCTARTRMGETTLLRWLLEPAALGEIRARQQAVAELRTRLDFREAMAVASGDVRSEPKPAAAGPRAGAAEPKPAAAGPRAGAAGPKPGASGSEPGVSGLKAVAAEFKAVASGPKSTPVTPRNTATAGAASRVGVSSEALLAWAEAPDVLRQRWWPWLAGLLALLAVVSLGVWFSRGLLAPLFVVLVLEAALRLPLKREMAAVLDGSDEALDNMQLLAALLECIESHAEADTFESERLRAIASKLFTHQVAGSATITGSAAIARLATLAEYRYSMDNPIVRVLNLPLLYSVQLAFAVQRWRRRHGPAVRLWLQAVGEMEALLSLAAYSYEHPADPFPEFEEEDRSQHDGRACFEAVDLGHPLLASSRCVRNTVRIGAQTHMQTRVLLVSGSNMSGKSTLLRTVGVNTVLAMCGAPVRARSLRLTPLRVAASLLVSDSLQSGQSRFYAEIERLSRICRLAGQPGGPRVLFLLDELLQGTNSKDRLVGAQGVIGALLRDGAIGMATTHDLALAAMEELENGAVRSMHFDDQIVAGQMQFDFRLQEGVVTRSNGIELMRVIGLDV